jgi:ATP-binding cassette, subfamily B, bacterial
VKALERVALLMLSRDDFERILVSNLGSAQIKKLIQVSAFLRRNPLFERWHPQALLQISRQFVLEECTAGQKVIEEGKTNGSFYLVYDGEFTVKKQGQTLAALKPGDFCGEISLLRNIPATADVVAGAKARCLRLDKERFLRLVSHDFLTGLTIETVVASRSGLTGGKE